ncbi:MAG: hydroxysqualene dehydroxylase HpnE [Casimicrobiaceae bacterium]
MDSVLVVLVAERIAVIGGGYAGFAAAVTLAAAGRQVTVFEAAKTLGGRARRLEAYDVVVNNGEHILLGAYAQTLALLRTVHGRRAERDLFDRRRLCLQEPGVFRLATPPLPAPWHLAAGLLTAHGLCWRERRATIALVRRWRRDRFRCAPILTVAQLLDRQPAAAIRHLWEPLCIAALNTPIEAASAQIFLNVLAAAFASKAGDSEVLLPRTDLSSLFPDAAAAYVVDRGGSIRQGTTVTGVASRGHGVVLRSGYSDEDFVAAVIAVAPHQLGHLLGDRPGSPEAARALSCVEQFAYEPIVTAYMKYERPLELSQPMQKLDGAPGQWLFDRGQLDGPSGLAAVVISTAQPGERPDHATLARAIDAQLRRKIPMLPPPAWLKVIAERRATYACRAGLARPLPGRIAPGLYLAGDYTDPELPATLEAATRSGVSAARQLLTS